MRLNRHCYFPPYAYYETNYFKILDVILDGLEKIATFVNQEMVAKMGNVLIILSLASVMKVGKEHYVINLFASKLKGTSL